LENNYNCSNDIYFGEVMSENTKKRMLKARDAIRAKQYDKARKLLEGVNHPTAKKWLVKLDKVAPKKTKIGLFQYVILCVIFVCAALSVLATFMPSTETPAAQPAATIMLTSNSVQTSLQPTLAHTVTPSGLQDPLSLSLIEIEGVEQVVTSNTLYVENNGYLIVTLGIHVSLQRDLGILLESVAEKTTVYASTFSSEGLTLNIDLTVYSGTNFDRWTYSPDGWSVYERNGIRVTVTPYPTSHPQAQIVQPVQPQAPVRSNTSNQSVAPSSSCNCSAGDTLNCPDFSNDSSAQACFAKCMREVGRDVHGLDGNNNGEACEANRHF
jgi:hypothetical protein